MAGWLAQGNVDIPCFLEVLFVEMIEFPYGVAYVFLISTRCEGESSKGTITRPYAHAGLAAGEAKCVIFKCFTDGFQNGLQFESKSPKGMMNKPYSLRFGGRRGSTGWAQR